MDVRFSKQQFLSQPAGLSQQLQNAVLERIQRVVDVEFREIVDDMNALGHGLSEYEVEPGIIHFRDDRDETGQGRKCDLRLAVDIIVSAGFRDTVDSVEELNI